MRSFILAPAPQGIHGEALTKELEAAGFKDVAFSYQNKETELVVTLEDDVDEARVWEIFKAHDGAAAYKAAEDKSKAEQTERADDLAAIKAAAKKDPAFAALARYLDVPLT